MSDKRASKSSPTIRRDDQDDWETDPDFIRDMDEIDQRWGAKRSIGSINMSKLIDEVHRDHEILREKFAHPSQSLRNKSDVLKERDFDYHRTSKEVSSREVITSSSSSVISTNRGSSREGIEDIGKRSLFNEKIHRETGNSSPSSFERHSQRPQTSPVSASVKRTSSPSHRAQTPESSCSRETVREIKTASPTKPKTVNPAQSSPTPSSSDSKAEFSSAINSIQAKIAAFKKDFEDIQSQVAKKRSEKITTESYKTSEIDDRTTRENVEYIEHPSSTSVRHQNDYPPTSNRPIPKHPAPLRASPSLPKQGSDFSNKANIKSLSERFETMGREDSNDFRRKTEERRKEFFNEIKNQVRETRRDLEGFDTIDDESYGELERRMRDKIERSAQSSNIRSSDNSHGRDQQSNRETYQSSSSTRGGSSSQQRMSSPQHSSNSNNYAQSHDRSQSSPTPKVYSKRETVREEIVSKIVKENDKIIQNETKRNVERSSSNHGSSDEDADKGHRRSVGQSEHKTTGAGSPSRVQAQSPSQASPATSRSSPLSPSKGRVAEVGDKGTGLMARTLYDYQAADNDELSFDVDELITNIEKVDPGWYKGTITQKNGKQQVGLFPANYVKLLNDTGEY